MPVMRPMLGLYAIVALIAFIGACHAVKHAYSSQSVHLSNHHDHHDQHNDVQGHHGTGGIHDRVDHHNIEEHDGHKEYHGLGVIHVPDQHYSHGENHNHQDNNMHEEDQGLDKTHAHDGHFSHGHGKHNSNTHRDHVEPHVNNYMHDTHSTLGVIYVPDEYHEDHEHDDYRHEHHESHNHDSFHGHDDQHGQHHEDLHDLVEYQSHNHHHEHKDDNSNHHVQNDHIMSEHKIELSVEHIVEVEPHRNTAAEPEVEEHNIKYEEVENKHGVKTIPVVEKVEEIHKKAIVPVKIVPVAHYVQSSKKQDNHHERAFFSQHMSSPDLGHLTKGSDNHSIVALSAVLAVAAAGLLPAAHYAPAAAVSSQNIVRHDEGHQIAHAPVAYAAAPAHYAAAPVAYAAAPAHYAAAPVHYAAPVAKVIAPIQKVLVSAHAEEYAHPKYEYNYSVADGHTGDNKSQQESRDGDVVKGSYSFLEADGSVRTVEYSADDHSGFNAVVHNTAPTAAPVVVKAAPVILKAAPAHYYHH
ncbi:unnamed protein product [Chrysodeixis includens]|uniref:Cuticle protein n=1 Tax=Chrysodeixis includens TaxID=689277 RepID=A0A9P0FWI7_CHRIL|nr:unnamed protein product [Chrysodeixis includens]